MMHTLFLYVDLYSIQNHHNYQYANRQHVVVVEPDTNPDCSYKYCNLSFTRFKKHSVCTNLHNSKTYLHNYFSCFYFIIHSMQNHHNYGYANRQHVVVVVETATSNETKTAHILIIREIHTYFLFLFVIHSIQNHHNYQYANRQHVVVVESATTPIAVVFVATKADCQSDPIETRFGASVHGAVVRQGALVVGGEWVV